MITKNLKTGKITGASIPQLTWTKIFGPKKLKVLTTDYSVEEIDNSSIRYKDTYEDDGREGTFDCWANGNGAASFYLTPVDKEKGVYRLKMLSELKKSESEAKELCENQAYRILTDDRLFPNYK